MSLFAILLPLVAQVGPFTAPGTRGTPFEQKVERPSRSQAVAAPAALPTPSVRTARGQDCLGAIDDDAEGALDLANQWLATAKGADRAEARLCLGLAHSRLEDWPEAEGAFLAGRDEAGADGLLRARLGAMGGNAALAAGAPDRALAALDQARTDVKGLASPDLEADIALDRARALVALKRDAEAEDALADARTAAPDSAEAWLLSATLARRTGKLAEAQARIERAAALMPVDPAIGLEAGVIAMLAGHDQAARRSWESVIKAAPDSAEANTAKGYLAQLGPTPSGTSPAPAASGGR